MLLAGYVYQHTPCQNLCTDSPSARSYIMHTLPYLVQLLLDFLDAAAACFRVRVLTSCPQSLQQLSRAATSRVHICLLVLLLLLSAACLAGLG